MASICCSPPDMVPARWWARSRRRGNRPNTCSMPDSMSASLAKKPPIFRFSTTVMSAKTRRPSGEMAMPLRMIRCEGAWVMSCPSNRMRPALARGLPHTVMSRVVLPAPLEPMRVTISPGFTRRLTSFTA